MPLQGLLICLGLANSTPSSPPALYFIAAPRTSYFDGFGRLLLWSPSALGLIYQTGSEHQIMDLLLDASSRQAPDGRDRRLDFHESPPIWNTLAQQASFREPLLYHQMNHSWFTLEDGSIWLPPWSGKGSSYPSFDPLGSLSLVMPRRSSGSPRKQPGRSGTPDVPDPTRQDGSSTPPERAATQSRDLKFITVTEQSLQGVHDAGEQKSIRAHVMRDFLRQRESGSEPPSQSQPPAPIAESQAQHMGRFRLATKPRKKQAPSKSGSSSSSASGAAHYPNREVLPKPLAGSSVSMLPLLESASQFDQTQMIQSLTTGRLDPFARFPVEDTSGTHELVDYYRTLFIQNSLAVNPEGKWFTYASTDPAVFHATLSLTAQHRAFAAGGVGLEEYYFHRGEAIRIVTERLGEPAREVNDATIGAVALLASSDQNMGGSSEALLYHMNGLEQMVNMRGGVETLADNEPVKRVVTWADLSNAAMHDTRPRFPLTVCPIGDDLAQRFIPPLPGPATSGSPRVFSEYQQLPVPDDMVEIFHDIRLLCIALENPSLINMQNSVNRRTHSNKLYHIEWCLLSAAPSSPARTPTTVTPHRPGTTEYEGYNNPPTAASCSMSPVSNACRHGALIFTYLALRNLPVSAAVFDNLVHRLRNALVPLLDDEQSNPGVGSHVVSHAGSPSGLNSQGYPEELPYNYFGSSNRQPSTSPFEIPGPLLVWLLTTGFAACPPFRAEQRAWYLSHVLRVCGRLGIIGIENLVVALKEILWLDSTCLGVVEDLAVAIRGLGRMGW